MNSIAVVVPTIREECIIKFLQEWRTHFIRNNCHVYVIEDNASCSFKIPPMGIDVQHLCHVDVLADIGKEDSWIIPIKTDCVRSYGYYKAWLDGYDYIITLDDDCYPITQERLDKDILLDFPELLTPIETHVKYLHSGCSPYNVWESTIGDVRPRGIPYKKTSRTNPIMLNHGLWYNVPDVDAITQLHGDNDFNDKLRMRDCIVPKGFYYPMCGMNIAFSHTIAPIMYFLLMGHNYPYDRFGDIWCGVIVKKILDHLGLAVHSGLPAIWHERASDPHVNFKKESPGYGVNEEIWRIVDGVVLQSSNLSECYLQIMKALEVNLLEEHGSYWSTLYKASEIWANLFKEPK